MNMSVSKYEHFEPPESKKRCERGGDKDVFNSVATIQIILGNMENLTYKCLKLEIFSIFTLSRGRGAIPISKVFCIVIVEYRMCKV